MTSSAPVTLDCKTGLTALLVIGSIRLLGGMAKALLHQNSSSPKLLPVLQVEAIHQNRNHSVVGVSSKLIPLATIKHDRTRKRHTRQVSRVIECGLTNVTHY